MCVGVYVEGAGDAAVPAVTGWFLLQATLQSLFRLMAAVQSRQSPSSSGYHLHDQRRNRSCHWHVMENVIDSLHIAKGQKRL